MHKSMFLQTDDVVIKIGSTEAINSGILSSFLQILNIECGNVYVLLSFQELNTAKVELLFFNTWLKKLI